MKTKLLALLAMATLVACGSKIEGTYKDKGGNIALKFKSNGTVEMTTMGITTELAYELEDKTLKLGKSSDGGRLLIKMLDDGSLDYAGMANLKKQK
jgi:hypothetical protein